LLLCFVFGLKFRITLLLLKGLLLHAFCLGSSSASLPSLVKCSSKLLLRKECMNALVFILLLIATSFPALQSPHLDALNYLRTTDSNAEMTCEIADTN